MISVIFPSRGRVDRLRNSVASLLDTASHPDRVEILVARDPDDDETLAADLPWRAAILTAPERYGYTGLHRYYNGLAEAAKGDWLFIWNDDCTMITPGWDEVIRAQEPGFLWPKSNLAPEINTFPVVPGAWARAIGHLSLDQSIDIWLLHLALITGTLRKIRAELHHEHAMGDATAADRDATASILTFWAPEMQAAREADAKVILGLLEGGTCA